MYLRETGTKPYTEFDEIHPVSAYGKTKAEGEKFVREFATDILFSVPHGFMEMEKTL